MTVFKLSLEGAVLGDLAVVFSDLAVIMSDLAVELCYRRM